MDQRITMILDWHTFDLNSQNGHSDPAISQPRLFYYFYDMLGIGTIGAPSKPSNSSRMGHIISTQQRNYVRSALKKKTFTNMSRISEYAPLLFPMEWQLRRYMEYHSPCLCFSRTPACIIHPCLAKTDLIRPRPHRKAWFRWLTWKSSSTSLKRA